jgi:hypothetical protein
MEKEEVAQMAVLKKMEIQDSLPLKNKNIF